MNELVKNLRAKDYNPCGELTGDERELCDEARKNYFNLPFVQVMRNVVMKKISEVDAEKISKNVEALESWAARNLSAEELRATFDFGSTEFENFSPAEVGLCKYYVHILFENRYNIFYNRLVDFCAETDEKIFSAAEAGGLSLRELEGKINFAAQEGTYSMTFNNLTDEFLNFLISYVNAGYCAE